MDRPDFSRLMSKRGLLLLVLFVVALGMGLSVWKHRPKHLDGKADNGRSDYVLTDFEAIVLDKQGRESFTLQAPKLTRSPGDRTMTIQTPVFFIPVAPAEGQAPTREAGWEVRSKTGWVSAEGDELRLIGAVDARTASGANRHVTIATERLNVFPRTHRATSPGTVTVVQPGSILRGQGMDARLDTKRVRFSSNVKASYVPSSVPSSVPSP
jgi:lipopolysaccharide export system protein LptC